MPWMCIETTDVVTWPGKSMATKAGSRTTTASDSNTANAGLTRIISVQIGGANSASQLDFLLHDGTTVIRSIACPGVSAGNMAQNINTIGFEIPGGFSAEAVGAGGGVEVYIQYEYFDKA